MEKSSSPEHNLLIRDEKKLQIVPFGKTESLFEIEKPYLLLNSKNLSGIITNGRLLVIDNTTFKELNEFPLEQVSQIHFSPNNNFVVTIQKPTVVEKNLSVFRLDDFSRVVDFRSVTHPNNIWPQIRFSNDEKFMFKCLENEIEVFEMTDLSTPLGSVDGVVSFKVADIRIEEHNLDETILLCGRVSEDKKKGKKKSLFSFYRISELKKPIKSFSISHCDEIRIDVADDNKNCLVLSSSAESKSSYYGDYTLYVCNLLYGVITKLISHKEGPILDFAWIDEGKQFLVVGGHQPAELSVYGVDTKKAKMIGNFKANKIYVSPDRRLACIVGFGNVIGDLIFIDLLKQEQIGQAFHRFGGDLVWSPDSKYILSTVLSPRLRVDNEYKVFTYNGDEVFSESFDREVNELKWMENRNVKYEAFAIEKSNKLNEIKEETKNSGSNLSNLDFDNIDFDKHRPATLSSNVPIGMDKPKKKK